MTGISVCRSGFHRCRTAALDQFDLVAGLDQVVGHRDADHAAAENEYPHRLFFLFAACTPRGLTVPMAAVSHRILALG
jgi:hypothetical protein